MFRYKKAAILVVFALLTIISGVNAQERTDQYNHWSVNPIRKDDIMFKKSLWFRVDLREKQNVPMFSDNNEITGLLIRAVKAGVVRPFRNDSLHTRLPLEDFYENLKMPGLEEEEDPEFADTDEWDKNDEVWKDGDKSKAKASGNIGTDEFLPKQLYVIELKEDLIFDRRRSRMYHDITAISIIIPGDQNPTGVDKVLATFSYKELVEDVFTNNPDAIWYNTSNSAEHRNLADAFSLRLFHGTLVKYENPKNNMIVDMYTGGKAALQASEQAVYKLMEYEANLWEN